MHGHYAYFEVLQTNYKYLNLLENTCSDKEAYGDRPSVTDCVEGFIERQLKCSIPWHSIRTERDECILEDQFVRYAEVSEQLSYLDEEQIWELTGCMRRCDQKEYRGTIDIFRRFEANKIVNVFAYGKLEQGRFYQLWTHNMPGR